MRTRVGYAGGQSQNPTYHQLGNHTETVEIVFDSDLISYEELLDEFWRDHNPTTPAFSKQYKSVIFYHSEAQREAAEQGKARREAQSGKTVYTEILPAPEFWPAEDYHQKYMLRRFGPIASEYYTIYPDAAEFRDSTAVARVNGYLGGYGNSEDLDNELPSLGLSPEAQQMLRDALRGR